MKVTQQLNRWGQGGCGAAEEAARAAPGGTVGDELGLQSSLAGVLTTGTSDPKLGILCQQDCPQEGRRNKDTLSQR